MYPRVAPGPGRHGANPEIYRDRARARLSSYNEVYTTQTALHNCLEPHGCTVAWEGDHLTIWESTQSVFEIREQVAEKLELLEHHVRVIKQYMGGGFGSKQTAWKHTVIAALLSRASGRPVQLMLDREAENLAVGNRNATRQCIRLGARRDGTLTAISVRIDQAGAYLVGGEGSNVSGTYQRLYRCANMRTEQVPVYTNTGPAVAFRAPGYVEGAFALESALDELARGLPLDPLRSGCVITLLRTRSVECLTRHPTACCAVTSRLQRHLAGITISDCWRMVRSSVALAWRRTTGGEAAGHPPMPGLSSTAMVRPTWSLGRRTSVRAPEPG